MSKIRRGLSISQDWDTGVIFVVLAGLSYAFWRILSHTGWQASLFVSLSVASFMIGCVGGFLFTSYGDEAATVGKVRDWLIGGLTGLTIAKFSAIKLLLLTFALGPGPKAYALTVAVSVIYSVLGFFAMFFQRELILNVLLAESRDRRGRVEGTKLAGLVTHQLLSALPPSLLAGLDGIDDDEARSKKPDAERLSELLKSDGVVKFLEQAEEACANGQLDWDVVSKAAILHYYSVYFADPANRDTQENTAIEWVTRALIMNPGHADLTAKYADLLSMTGDNHECVLTLERLDRSPESPAYVRQWLGYYLLYLPDRQDESIAYSEDYHKRFPDETDSLYNIARAYAQKYSLKKRLAEATSDPEHIKLAELLREQTLTEIKRVLTAESESELSDAKKWIRQCSDFQSLTSDSEYQSLIV